MLMVKKEDTYPRICMRDSCVVSGWTKVRLLVGARRGISTTIHMHGTMYQGTDTLRARTGPEYAMRAVCDRRRIISEQISKHQTPS